MPDDQPLNQQHDIARQAMADFLANMSHEIRTPLNAIIGMAYLVQQSELTPQQRENMVKIEAAGQHLLGIVNDMLDYTRLEAGEIALSRAAFAPAALLEETVRRYADKALAKRLNIVAQVEPGMPVRLLGDQQRIGQIMRHYIDNAIKFTEKGGMDIVLRADPPQPGQQLTCRLHCAVRDTGVGLDKSQRGELFQPFRQADGSSTRKFGGTGLGLAIARKLAEIMGGAVSVDSIVGKGSTFRFDVLLEVEPTTPLLGEAFRLLIEPPVAAPRGGAEPCVDRQRLAAANARLLSLLADDDAEAPEWFAQHADLLRAAWPADFHTLEQAIRDFDFPLALQLLERLCAN